MRSSILKILVFIILISIIIILNMIVFRSQEPMFWIITSIISIIILILFPYKSFFKKHK